METKIIIISILILSLILNLFLVILIFIPDNKSETIVLPDIVCNTDENCPTDYSCMSKQCVKEIIKDIEEITNIECSLENPCPENLECYKFPDIGYRCAEPEPCDYYCEDKTCAYAKSNPPQVFCIDKKEPVCGNGDCEKGESPPYCKAQDCGVPCPKDCGSPECNSNNDCKNGLICGLNGKCYNACQKCYNDCAIMGPNTGACKESTEDFTCRLINGKCTRIDGEDNGCSWIWKGVAGGSSVMFHEVCLLNQDNCYNCNIRVCKDNECSEDKRKELGYNFPTSCDNPQDYLEGNSYVSCVKSS